MRLWSLLRLFFVWRVADTKPDEARENPPDCIIMLAFGQQVIGNPPDDVILPGPANEAIACDLVWSLRTNFSENTPVLAQWELTETRYLRKEKRVQVTPFGSKYEYRSTREILEEMKGHMVKMGWERATIVAHPRHLVRCIWTAEKLGITVVNDQYLVEGLNYDADIWNVDIDVPDNQRQTTSLKRWLWYEFRARGYFWLKGWI